MGMLITAKCQLWVLLVSRNQYGTQTKYVSECATALGENFKSVAT